MNRLLTFVLALLVSTGCYINAKLPLDRDLNRTQLGTKVGKASVKSVLWAFAWGDAGTQAAAADGDLSTIEHADQEVLLLLGGLYVRLTTVVYGE
jgi:hypothetical protein